MNAFLNRRIETSLNFHNLIYTVGMHFSLAATVSKLPLRGRMKNNFIQVTQLQTGDAYLLSQVPLFEAPQTIACQALLSVELYRQEYQNGLSFPISGDLLDPAIKPMSLSSALTGRFFTTATWDIPKGCVGSYVHEVLNIKPQSKECTKRCLFVCLFFLC